MFEELVAYLSGQVTQNLIVDATGRFRQLLCDTCIQMDDLESLREVYAEVATEALKAGNPGDAVAPAVRSGAGCLLREATE